MSAPRPEPPDAHASRASDTGIAGSRPRLPGPRRGRRSRPCPARQAGLVRRRPRTSPTGWGARTSSIRFPSPIWGVQVQVHPQVRAVPGPTSARCRAARGERRAPGGRRQVLRFSSRRHHPSRSPSRRSARRVSTAASHISPLTVSTGCTGRPCGQPGAVQVEVRRAEHWDASIERSATGAARRAVPVGERPVDVPGHRGERRAGGGEGGEVVGRPVPDLDREARRRGSGAHGPGRAGRGTASRRRPRA
jgi:hypothetical protein